MPYGQGKMIGDTVDPRLFVQDYSGFADAARMQAQGYAALGQGIGTAIEKLGDYKKQQSEQEKAVKRADTIASLIEKQLPEFAGEVAPIRAQLGDKNIPLKDRFAAAESINDILNIGTQIKKLQLDEAQVMSSIGARSEQRPVAEWEIINVPAKDGSTVMAERNKFTGEIRRPDFSGLSGGGVTQDMGGGSVPTPEGDFSRSPALPGESSDLMPISEDLLTEADRQGRAVEVPIQGGAAADSIASVLPARGEIEAAQTRGIDATTYGNAAPEQAGPELGMTPPKISTTNPPRAVYTNEQFNKAREEGASINAIQRPDGKWDVYNINYGQPEGGIVNEYDENGRLIKTTIGGKGGKVSDKSERVEQARKVSARENIRILANAAEEVLNYENIMAETPVTAAAAGLFAKALPASEQGQMEKSVEAYNNAVSFGSMVDLRKQSETGGAAGSMTEKEWPRFETKFVKLFPGMNKEQRIKGIKLNLLNAYEAANGTPSDVISLLEKGKITQEQYNEYVDGYSMVRESARVGPDGIPGAANKWTRFDADLLKKYTGKEPIGQQVRPQDEVDEVDAKRKALREQYGF